MVYGRTGHVSHPDRCAIEQCVREAEPWLPFCREHYALLDHAHRLALSTAIVNVCNGVALDKEMMRTYAVLIARVALHIEQLEHGGRNG